MASLADAWREIREADARRLAARLTWLLFLLDPLGHAFADLPLTLLAVVGLVSRRLEASAGLWWVASLLCALPVLEDWMGVDNHAFLRVYWTLALAISASAEAPTSTLSRNARGLIGAAFAFAVLWKGLLSPDFIDGTYFRFAFLTDSRFADWSALLVGLAPADQAQNREWLAGWLSTPAATWDHDFIEPARLGVLALATAIWTLFIEAVIALSFLWPEGKGPSRLRDLPLLVFGITTYAVATVEGFGWLLCIMGVAQCDPHKPRMRLAYLAMFVVIACYARIPWGWLLWQIRVA
jgi:hypothetical protein